MSQHQTYYVHGLSGKLIEVPIPEVVFVGKTISRVFAPSRRAPDHGAPGHALQYYMSRDRMTQLVSKPKQITLVTVGNETFGFVRVGMPGIHSERVLVPLPRSFLADRRVVWAKRRNAQLWPKWTMRQRWAEARFVSDLTLEKVQHWKKAASRVHFISEPLPEDEDDELPSWRRIQAVRNKRGGVKLLMEAPPDVFDHVRSFIGADSLYNLGSVCAALRARVKQITSGLTIVAPEWWIYAQFRYPFSVSKVNKSSFREIVPTRRKLEWPQDTNGRLIPSPSFVVVLDAAIAQFGYEKLATWQRAEFAIREAHMARKEALREWLRLEYLVHVQSDLFSGRMPLYQSDKVLLWIFHPLPACAGVKYQRACYPKTLSYMRKTLKCRHSLEDVKAEVLAMRTARSRVRYVSPARRREVAALVAPNDPHTYDPASREAVEIRLVLDAKTDP